MFKLKLAQYISDNMVNHNMTYKDIAARSGVPQTTLSSYAHGQVTTPNEEYCVKIAAVFGDPPEIIEHMRRGALESTAEENKLIASANDKERMEKMAELLRANMIELLNDFSAQTSTRQTEIINHADKRIADAEADFKRRIDAINEQYSRHEQEYKVQCDTAMEIERRGYERIIEQQETSSKYLRALIQNLALALAMTVLIVVVCIAYLIIHHH